MVVSMLVGILSALALNTGRQADTASTSDRNYDLALGVTEAGTEQAISRIQAALGSGQYVTSFGFSGATPQGTYEVDVTRTTQGFQIDSEGTSGGDRFGRSRHVRVTLAPPRVFAGAGTRYVLFSNTSIEIKNNDEITGDAWANDSVALRQGSTVHGSVSAAKSWIELEGNTRIDGDAWSGGYSPLGFAMQLGNGAIIGGNATASVSAPSDPDTCQGEPQASYAVATGSGSSIGGNLTTLGAKTGPGTVGGVYSPNRCTRAAAAQPMPTFTFNPDNYDPATYHEFSSVSSFRAWLSTNGTTNLRGTFNVQDPAPSQANRIDLSGATMSGDTTIYTNAPVFTGGLTDANVIDGAILEIVSTYAPPTSTACDVNADASECSVHVKNNFSSTCRTTALIHTQNGPVAVKNGQKMCGTIIAEAILIKNLQVLEYDERLERVTGFGNSVYEIEEWQELPTS